MICRLIVPVESRVSLDVMNVKPPRVSPAYRAFMPVALACRCALLIPIFAAWLRDNGIFSRRLFPFHRYCRGAFPTATAPLTRFERDEFTPAIVADTRLIPVSSLPVVSRRAGLRAKSAFGKFGGASGFRNKARVTGATGFNGVVFVYHGVPSFPVNYTISDTPVSN